MSGNKPAEWEATYEKAHVHFQCGFPVVEPGSISNYQESRFTHAANGFGHFRENRKAGYVSAFSQRRDYVDA